MAGIIASDAYIREEINRTSATRIDEAIREFIHDDRNQEIARRKIIQNKPYERLAEEFSLTPGQIKNIIRKARRIIFEHL